LYSVEARAMCEWVFEIGKLVYKVTGVAPETEFGILVAVNGTRSLTQACTIAFLVADGVVTISSV
jgi:hypothetical protein